MSDDRSLLELCIPTEQPSVPVGAFTDQDGKGFTVSSFNPNLRIAGGQISEAQVSQAPGIPAVKMQAITMLVFMGASFLQIVRYKDRSFIRDGNHRAAGLIRRGIFEVPCIFIEARSFDEVGAASGTFSYETLYGELCDLFAGRRRPMFGTLRAICHALELSLTDVIEFSAPGPKRVDLGANAADGSRAALL